MLVGFFNRMRDNIVRADKGAAVGLYLVRNRVNLFSDVFVLFGDFVFLGRARSVRKRNA